MIQIIQIYACPRIFALVMKLNGKKIKSFFPEILFYLFNFMLNLPNLSFDLSRLIYIFVLINGSKITRAHQKTCNLGLVILRASFKTHNKVWIKSPNLVQTSVNYT